MLRLIARRLLWSIPLVIAVSGLTFLLVYFVPGNAAQHILGPSATEDQVNQLRAQLGLDQSLAAQYWHWAEDALRGDLGTSLYTNESVSSMLIPRLWVTLTVILIATAVTFLIGVSLGLLAATKGGLLGRIVEWLSILGLAIPNFWLALVLITIFSVSWRLFPATGYVSFFDSPSKWAMSLVLPVIVLTVGQVTFLAVQTRDSMLDVLNRSYVRVMRANGFSRNSILYKHCLRNAAIPVVTLTGVMLVNLLGGAVIVETIFAVTGIGGALTSAAGSHDIAVLQGIVVYFTLIVVVVNLLADVLCGLLDPRVRTS
jgi:peptide/nickel transport system permease protein